MHNVSNVARWAGVEPALLLNRVHVSRAFTCHQMLALTRKLPRFARKRNARLLLLPSLVNTFYDEAIPAREVKAVWHDTLNQLTALASQGFLVLALCPHHQLEQKRALNPSLYRECDRVISLHANEEGRLSLKMLKPERKTYELTFPYALSALWHPKRG